MWFSSLQAIVDMAVIAILSWSVWRKNHVITPLHYWDMAKKVRQHLLQNYTFFTTENGQIFLLYLDDKKHEYLRIYSTNFTKQKLLGS